MKDIGKKSVKALARELAAEWNEELTVSQRRLLASEVEELIRAVVDRYELSLSISIHELASIRDEQMAPKHP